MVLQELESSEGVRQVVAELTKRPRSEEGEISLNEVIQTHT